MISILGHLVVDAALVLAAVGAVAAFGGMRVPELAVWGRRAVFGVAGLVAIAVLLLLLAEVHPLGE